MIERLRKYDRGARVLELLQEQGKQVRRLHKRLDQLERIVGAHGLQGELGEARQALGTIERTALLQGVEVPYPERLQLHRFRMLSQNEEDGVTFALLRAAGFAPRRFVEIGCGTNGGNSGFLADELGWQGAMFDASQANIDRVARRFNAQLVTARQEWVTAENADELVTDAGFEGEIGFLGIDIDGNDFWVWKALTAVRPRVVCVEYNSFWGPERSVAVPYDARFDRHAVDGARGQYYGASLAALGALGTEKGYRLVTTDHRGVNAFFLREDVATDIPACDPARTYRLLDSNRAMLEDGWDLETFVADRGLPVVDVG